MATVGHPISTQQPFGTNCCAGGLLSFGATQHEIVMPTGHAATTIFLGAGVTVIFELSGAHKSFKQFTSSCLALRFTEDLLEDERS